ncbi:MAG: carboxypeptidase regulatory-like domain-containing protein, partial [Armatimonadota bacterium]
VRMPRIAHTLTRDVHMAIARLLTKSALLAVLTALLSGCGGVTPTPAPTAGIAVIDAVDADTNEPLAVEASAVCGGVRGAITVAEGSVVLRAVPFGTATPPAQPLTVSAPGYVTFADVIQISMTLVTFSTATMKKANLANTGTVRGKITSKSGDPVTSALVKFTQAGVSDTSEVRGYTDKDGAYQIGGIPIGLNTVSAEATGFVTTTQQTTVVQDNGGTNPETDLSLISGDTKLEVNGTVTDAFNQKPLKGALVKLGSMVAVQTDAAGDFTLKNVVVGTYLVTVTLTGYDDLKQSVDVLPGMGRLRLAMTTVAPAPPGGPYNLAGKVTLNGRTDNSGVVVSAVAIATARELGRVTTPASGEYTMFLPPGEYRLTATYDSRSVRRTVVVPGGGRVLSGVDFVLTATATAQLAPKRLLPVRR